MITQLQPITVEFNVAEDAVPQIVQAVRSGKILTVEAYDRANTKKLATGTLEAFNSQIDPTTGTLRLRATFKNDDDALFPNQFVNAQLLVDTHKGVTLLPNNAIQRNDNGTFVYLVQPNQTVALKTITVGTNDGNVSEVQDLQPGAVVAADSFNRLSDGAKIAIRPTASEAKPASPNQIAAVSPSRPFILRPVATSLLMAAILLSGAVAYKQLGHFRAAAGGLSDDPGGDILSGRESGCHGFGDHRAAGTAVRTMPGLNQMTSISSGGSSIITLQFALNLNIDVAEQEVQAAINAAQTYLPRGSAVAADLQQIESC